MKIETGILLAGSSHYRLATAKPEPNAKPTGKVKSADFVRRKTKVGEEVQLAGRGIYRILSFVAPDEAEVEYIGPMMNRAQRRKQASRR